MSTTWRPAHFLAPPSQFNRRQQRRRPSMPVPLHQVATLQDPQLMQRGMRALSGRQRRRIPLPNLPRRQTRLSSDGQSSTLAQDPVNSSAAAEPGLQEVFERLLFEIGKFYARRSRDSPP